MTTLTGTNLLTYENGQTEIYAVWQDELGTFSAIHRLDGTVSVKTEGANPPRLTHSQGGRPFTQSRKTARRKKLLSWRSRISGNGRFSILWETAV